MNKALEIASIAVIITALILLAFLFGSYCWNLVFGLVNERLESAVEIITSVGSGVLVMIGLFTLISNWERDRWRE